MARLAGAVVYVLAPADLLRVLGATAADLC